MAACRCRPCKALQVARNPCPCPCHQVGASWAGCGCAPGPCRRPCLLLLCHARAPVPAPVPARGRGRRCRGRRGRAPARALLLSGACRCHCRRAGTAAQGPGVRAAAPLGASWPAPGTAPCPRQTSNRQQHPSWWATTRAAPVAAVHSLPHSPFAFTEKPLRQVCHPVTHCSTLPSSCAPSM